MWYDPKLTKYDITAQLMGEGCVEDYQYLFGTIHLDDEDGPLYVTQKVYIRRSPVGQVILVNRAPIHRNKMVSSKADSAPIHVVDIVRMTGEIIENEEAVCEK